MAMLIKTTLGPSPIAGVGVFAAEFIPQGTKVWEFTPNFDMVFESLGEFSPLVQDFLTTYCYMSGGRYIFCADNARFFNHVAGAAASCRDDADCTYAARDLAPGEELTSDYGTFGITAADFAFNTREVASPNDPPVHILVGGTQPDSPLP